MAIKHDSSSRRHDAASRSKARHHLPGQIVMVFQGGGALGAYQVGVYQALHEAGIEPHWVIGTSIGAINASIIARNAPEHRLANLDKFWSLVERAQLAGFCSPWPMLEKILARNTILSQGIDKFFVPNPQAAWGMHMPVGVENAAYYSTAPLKDTLGELTDFALINARHVRLTIGAVKVRTGELRYFDNREEAIGVEHIMASGALPPGFPAIRINGDAYWDGGIYSNTPIEAVLEDHQRRDSLIFAVNVWHPDGAEPETIWQVLARHKDIQYASRVKSHIARQEQIHRLRHVIHELARRLPERSKAAAAVRELAAYGCTTRMHVVHLIAPHIDGEDHTKDIDFTVTGIRARRQAGYADARKMLNAAPWMQDVDPLAGVLVHAVRPEA